MKAVPAFAIGEFQEGAVPAALRASFAASWVHRMPANTAPPIIVAPDGTIDLQWIDGVLRIAGPDKEAKTETVPAGAMIVGFRFRPAAASAWLRTSASEIVGQRPALEDFWGGKARRLAESVRVDGICTDTTSIVRSLEAALIEHAPAAFAPDRAMQAAYALIEAGPPAGVPLVPWLARSLGMSERTLRRRFEESFGYGPKTLDRILRYKRFVRLSRTSAEPTAVLAALVGYSDQAHLVRESRRLSGVTPRGRVRATLAAQGARS